MRIHMGIFCERRRKVHLIATSSSIQFSRSGNGVYGSTARTRAAKAAARGLTVSCTAPVQKSAFFGGGGMFAQDLPGLGLLISG